MSDFTLLPTIDLEAELKSITERQHLNQVHFTVQLVRHALELAPSHIHLRVSRRCFELSHDGEPLSAEEQALLLCVTGGTEAERQEALSALERRCGVALLSLLLTSERVELYSRHGLRAVEGRVAAGRPSSGPGYVLRVWRAGRSAREEKAELRFYCRHARVPVTINGRRINAPLTLERALLERPFHTVHGSGLVGIPAWGSLSRMRYYKRGVYFGVRQSLPVGGKPVEATFDSSRTGYEDNFAASVSAANDAIRSASRQLYADLPALFPQMTPVERARVKAVALSLPRLEDASGLASLPLFDTSVSSWRLSLAELAQRVERLSYLPYLPRPERGDDDLPLLAVDEVVAASRLLRVPARRALRFTRDRGLWGVARRAAKELRAALKSEEPARPLPAEALDDDTRRLLSALARERPDLRFCVTEGGEPWLDERGPVRRMCLPRTDPTLQRAVERFRSFPDEIDAIGAALLTVPAA
jgi:hypothetical protein